MHVPPKSQLIGGGILLTSFLSVELLESFHGLDWLKEGFPPLYNLAINPTFKAGLLIVGVIALISALIEVRRQQRSVKEKEVGTVESVRQELHNSPIGGDSRMAARDYHEVHQTTIHAAPLLEARLAEFQQIDELICKKDEIQLREALDFPNILKFNIAMTRRSFAPRTVSASESKEIDDFFKDGKAVVSAKYSTVTRINERINVVGIPGKVFIVNISRKYTETRALLMAMYSSSKLPESVSAALKDFDKSIEDNMALMIDSLNDSLSTNRRNVLENDDPSSDRHGSASNRYWSKFVHLKPKANTVNSAIRSFLDIK